MEWFVEKPERAKVAVGSLVVLVTVLIVWFGRKRPGIAIACALMFLFVVAMTGPSIIPARYMAQRNACIANLKAIQAAKAEWANANRKDATERPRPEDLFGTDRFLCDAKVSVRRRIQYRSLESELDVQSGGKGPQIMSTRYGFARGYQWRSGVRVPFVFSSMQHIDPPPYSRMARRLENISLIRSCGFRWWRRLFWVAEAALARTGAAGRRAN